MLPENTDAHMNTYTATDMPARTVSKDPKKLAVLKENLIFH